MRILCIMSRTRLTSTTATAATAPPAHRAMFTDTFAATCSPLFATSALTSLFIGERNRGSEKERTAANLASRRQLEESKRRYEDEKFDADLAQRRLTLEQGRAYQIIESKEKLDSQTATVQFRHFLQNCWPLKLDIYTIWNLDEIFAAHATVPLTVILSRPNAAAGRDFYDDTPNLAEHLADRAAELGDIKVIKDAWRDTPNNTGGTAPGLNIHHVMQGRPTLLITPQWIAGTLYFDATLWSFAHGLGSLLHRPLYQTPCANPADYPALKPKIQAALLAITGTVRDAYATLEHHKPATLHKLTTEFTDHPEISTQILAKQYTSLHAQLNTRPELTRLASPSELTHLNNSIKTFLN
jgi:hypothetical protein